MNIDGTIGTGIGLNASSDQVAIQVYVRRLNSQIRSALPAELEGVPVVLVETGDVVAY